MGEEELPNCVFYEDVKCRVRAEMLRESALSKIIQPSGPAQVQIATQLAQILKSIMTTHWSSLVQFCMVCPIKREREEEHEI